MAVSPLKGRSWGFPDNIVLLSADPADYPCWQGDLARGLRVSNFVLRRPRYLLWDFHQRAFADLPVTLVGHNPEIPGVQPSRGWDGLKQTFSRHRFFIHTADPQLEDGYNMASLEAMAAGLPVLGNDHPGSPIVHGVSGFRSNDPAELNAFARLLLNDRGLAEKMGRAAQRLVAEQFSPAAFSEGLTRSIAAAQSNWHTASPQLPL
jgi:glycosyltransferase involved in cell wall biosynthesis